MPTYLSGSVLIETGSGVLVPGEGSIATNVNSHTLTAGDETFTVDFSAMNLSAAPDYVLPSGPVSKTAASQYNIYGTYIEGSKTATSAQFTLNAPCDVTGRIFYFIVVPG